MPKIHLVTSISVAEDAVRKLLCVPEATIAVRCHGVHIGDKTKGALTSVTCSSACGDVYIFDVKTCDDIVLKGGLIRIFQSTELVKVFHDCSADNMLLKKYGVKIRNYFDTSVAYGVILEQNGLPPRKICLQNICDKYGIERFKPDRQEQRKVGGDVNYFGLRPMTRLMMNLCAADVSPLLPALYHTLANELDPDSWEWFDCMSEENKLSRTQKERIRSTRSQRKHQRYLNKLYEYPIVKMTHKERQLLQHTAPDSQEYI